MQRINKLTINMTDEKFLAVAATLNQEELQHELASCETAISNIKRSQPYAGFDPLPGHQRLRDQLRLLTKAGTNHQQASSQLLEPVINQAAGVNPTIGTDWDEDRIDLTIKNWHTTSLENEFHLQLNKIKQLKDEQAQAHRAAELNHYRTVLNKIKTALEQRTQPEYVALITQLNTYEKTENHNQELLAAAHQLKNHFKFNTRATDKAALTAATNVLADNSTTNRNQFLDVIKRCRSDKFKRSKFVLGILLTFVGAAMITAGIACAATGVGFLPAYFLVAFGAIYFLGPGIFAIGITTHRSYAPEENSLVEFGDGMIAAANQTTPASCTAKIGIFSVTKETQVVNPHNAESEEVKLRGQESF